MLQTKRLILTPASGTDLVETFALTSLPEVNLYNPDGPDTTPAETAQALTQWESDWQRDGIGYYTARLRETGTYVGYRKKCV